MRAYLLRSSCICNLIWSHSIIHILSCYSLLMTAVHLKIKDSKKKVKDSKEIKTPLTTIPVFIGSISTVVIRVTYPYLWDATVIVAGKITWYTREWIRTCRQHTRLIKETLWDCHSLCFIDCKFIQVDCFKMKQFFSTIILDSSSFASNECCVWTVWVLKVLKVWVFTSLSPSR